MTCDRLLERKSHFSAQASRTKNDVAWSRYTETMSKPNVKIIDKLENCKIFVDWTVQNWLEFSK